MMRHSDFLQKISSSATPPNGRMVPSMDEILKRELAGRCLDEADIKSQRFQHLVSQLFPSPRFLLDITAKELNSAYKNLSDHHNTKDEGIALTQPTASSATRNLQPHTCSQVAKKKRQLHAFDLKHSTLYDTKKKRWKVDGFQPRKADIALENAIQQHFLHSKPPTLYTGISIPPGAVVDGPAPVNWNQAIPEPSSSTIQPPAQHGDTDTDNMDRSCSSSEAAPRKEAAYNGDSSWDKDYFEGKQREGKKGPVPPETQWSAFLNATAEAILVFSRISSANHECRWYGSFSAKPLPSEDGQVNWNHKPDLILLGGGGDDLVTWGSPKALSELTSSDFNSNTTLIKTLSTKVYILLCSQPW